MAGQPVSALQDMLAGMAPVLHPTRWCFALIDDEAIAAMPPAAFAIIREAEGVTAIIPGEVGDGPSFARITLQVHSALEGVGLTAAVAGALAEVGIACNVVAGLYHDHLFVPWERREAAMAILMRLAAGAQQ